MSQTEISLYTQSSVVCVPGTLRPWVSRERQRRGAQDVVGPLPLKNMHSKPTGREYYNSSSILEQISDALIW